MISSSWRGNPSRNRSWCSPDVEGRMHSATSNASLALLRSDLAMKNMVIDRPLAPVSVPGSSSFAPARRLRVVHSVWGSFHLNLTRELHQRGMLERFFTSFPRWRFRDENIPLEKIQSDPWLYTLLVAKQRYRLGPRLLDRAL